MKTLRNVWSGNVILINETGSVFFVVKEIFGLFLKEKGATAFVLPS
jgi:hypothetical protein